MDGADHTFPEAIFFCAAVSWRASARSFFSFRFSSSKNQRCLAPDTSCRGIGIASCKASSCWSRACGRSAGFAPALCSFGISIICFSLNRFR
jgi:hypothetical protein